MRSKREVQTRLASENDAFAIEVLRWVLAGGCPMCEHPNKKDMEMDVYNGDSSPSYLEAKNNCCLLYTSDAADDTPCVDLGGRRII